MKLYKVKCQRFPGIYVVANNPTEAYDIIREDLDDRDLWFPKDRELDSIQLIADESKFVTDEIPKLYLSKEVKWN